MVFGQIKGINLQSCCSFDFLSECTGNMHLQKSQYTTKLSGDFLDNPSPSSCDS